jgi:hypothetical protein
MGKITPEEWRTWYKKELQKLNDTAKEKITKEVEFKNEKDAVFIIPYLGKDEGFDFYEFLRVKARSFCKVKKTDRILLRKIYKNTGTLSETEYFVEDVNLFYDSDIKEDFQHKYKLQLSKISSKGNVAAYPFKIYEYFELDKNTLVKDTTHYFFSIKVLNE